MINHKWVVVILRALHSDNLLIVGAAKTFISSYVDPLSIKLSKSNNNENLRLDKSRPPFLCIHFF